jgi:DNA adenine methylase
MHYPDCLIAIIDRLRGVVIENRDALEVLEIHDTPDTLHYVDPPYLPETRDPGEDYRHEMTVEQHVKLSELLQVLKGQVILSGYPSELYNDLYSNWHRVDRNALADGARKRIECIWIKEFTGGLF